MQTNMFGARHSGNQLKVYVDFDSCYYNIARRIYKVAPWTVITNRFNHIISMPHWLEGHFGAKKITYFAPPVKVRLKTKPFVGVFNIDTVPDRRSIMAAFIAGILEDVKALTPDASVVHKDSIVAEVECSQVNVLREIIRMPCTIGVGQSEEEAKSDCTIKKEMKKRSLVNAVLFVLYVIPMTTFYLVSNKEEKG